MADHLEVHLDGAGRGTIELNGAPLLGVRGFTLVSAANSYPRLTLDVPVLKSSDVIAADTRVLICDETRATLIAIGWTPPAHQAAPVDGFTEYRPPCEHSWGELTTHGDGVRRFQCHHCRLRREEPR